MKHAKVLLPLMLLLGVSAVLIVACGDDKSAAPPPCYTVTTNTVGSGSIQLSPDSSCYHSGTAVTLTAIPNTSWEFGGWSGDTTSAENPLTLTIGGDVSVTASFAEMYSLTAQVDPPQSGTVVLTPDQEYFSPGDTVAVEAQANQYYGFSHWSYGSQIRSENPTTIVFGQADEAITALFGSLEGEPDCADEYVDFYNGGCNSSPEVFQPIADGQIILARGGNFIYQTLSYRDTDWFRIVVSDNRILTFTGVAEFDLQLFLIDGTNGCASYTILDDFAAPANDTAMVTATVGPGIYWMWAGTAGFTGWPCPQDYKVWFTAELAVGALTPTPGRSPVENELSNIK